jgi:hypothetical protein
VEVEVEDMMRALARGTAARRDRPRGALASLSP